MKEMKGVGSSYVYDMVEDLAPTKTTKEKRLFSWDRIPGEANYKLFQKLVEIYKLNWGRNGITEPQSELEFKKSVDNKLLTISYTPTNFISIKLSENQQTNASVIIHTDGKTVRDSFVTKYHDKKASLDIYAKVSNSVRIRYLDISRDIEADKLISNIKERKRATEPRIDEREFVDMPEILKIENDKKYWRYRLNARGLVRYLLGEFEDTGDTSALEKHGGRSKERQDEGRKKGRKKGHVSTTKRICKVMDNLSENYVEEFPFLLYYRDFEKEYSRLEALKKLPEHFVLIVLKEIAKELEFQLEGIDLDFLRYWVTRRYYKDITDYFDWLERPVQKFELLQCTSMTYDKLNNYRITILRYLLDYHERETSEMKKILERYTRQ